MTTLNLGALQGPLLFFGGPCSNLQATQAIRAESMRLDIPAENCFCTGDVVAYCAQPNETIAQLRDWGIAVVMGNCEQAIGSSTEDCGCGFAEGSTCDLLSNSWYSYTNSRVRSNNRAWMLSLPGRIDFEYAGRGFAVVHGSVSRINQFIFSSTRSEIKNREIELAGTDGVIGGHCGLPFTQKLGDTLWHNPGVIGMPANDGTPRGWYSIWRCERESIWISIRSFNYDTKKARVAMIEAGLVNAYADGLETGLWPAMDVLPDAERTKCGLPLSTRVDRFPLNI